MSNIGKRIKSVILKGKSFWNWKNESNIDVALPNPKDYRNKITYDTNVELIFNREAIVTKVYSDPKQIPALETLIPQGYKLLYPSNNTIQVYNNNIFVLVYDYYDLIVHYRDESNPNVDISLFKGRYQYGTLITANMINWPAGRGGKDDWIEFPIGELTPARVTDRYVYLPSGTSTPETTPENMKYNTVIEMTINHTGKEYISRSSVTFIPGYIDNTYINKYLYGRLPIGVKSNYSFNINKGSVNNIEIGASSDRLPEIPKAYYVGANNNITKVNYIKNGSSAQRFNVVPIIWYDKKDPLFEKFYDNNPSDIKPFFDKYLSNMIAEYITGHRVPNGTYGRPFESNNKMNNIIPSFKVFKTENNTPFIYMINKTVFDKNVNPNETKAVFNIGEVLTKVESENTDYKDYFRTRCFTIDIDRVDDTFTYTTIENFTLNGQTADLLCYLVPLDRISYIGLYTNKEKMYKHYFSSIYKENSVIDSNIVSSVPANTSGGISVFGGVKKTGYKELKNPVGPTTYEEYKSSNGDRISFASGDYITKYKHTHNMISAKADLIRNEQSFLDNKVIDETSILIESRKEGISGNISEDTKQKYRIHFFDENGLEMKEYLTDQWIKEGSAPSPYPPRGYTIDPDKPWTRNPNDNKEIYVYLIKKMCRITIEFRLSNPNNFKHKYWQSLIGVNTLHSAIYLVGEKVNVAKYLSDFKNDHSAKISDIKISSNQYENKTDFEVEDTTTIIFEAKIIKNDNYINTISLSNARREFSIINPYFDYCLAAVIVNKNSLIPQSQFEQNLTTRTNNLISFNSPTGLDNSFEKTALETSIVYKNNLYKLFPSKIIPKIEIWKVKDGVRTLKETLNNIDIKSILGVSALGVEKLGTGTTNFVNKKIASNIAKYLVDDMNNTSWKDQFSYAYANSPDVITNGVDLEIKIEWPDDIHTFIYNNDYAVEIKLIPTALLPIYDYDNIYNDNDIKEGLDIVYNFGDPGKQTFNPMMIRFDSIENIKNMILDKDSLNYNNVSSDFMEVYKLIGYDTLTGTLGFLYRPYSIYQILSRPIPIMIVSDGNICNRMTSNVIPDNITKLTQINNSKNIILTPELVSHSYTRKIPTVLCSDEYMVPYASSDWSDYSYIISSTVLGSKIHGFPTTAYYDKVKNKKLPLFGTNSIESWFKLINSKATNTSEINVRLLQDVISCIQTLDYAYISHERSISTPYDINMSNTLPTLMYRNDKITNMIKSLNANDCGLKYIRLTTVAKDPYGSDIAKRFTLLDTPETILSIKNYHNNSTTDVKYIDVYNQYDDGDEFINVNTAYSGYLKSIPVFKEFIKYEVISTSIFKNKTEFFIFSGCMYNSISEALSTLSSQGTDICYDLRETIKNSDGLKDMVERGEILLDYTGDKNIFDNNSAIDCIFTNNNIDYIGKFHNIEWEKVNSSDTIVMDFDRKYALGISTVYSRTWIIPELAKLIGWKCFINNRNLFINDDSMWVTPFHRFIENNTINGLNYNSPDNSYKLKTVSVFSINVFQTQPHSVYSNYLRSYTESIWYSLVMFDIMNNPNYDDPYATKVNIINKNNTVQYRYKRYPDNNAINTYINIHLYNQITTSGDAVNLTASRYDYRFDPSRIKARFFGFSLYEIAMKLTNIWDLYSSERQLIYGREETAVNGRFIGNINSFRDNQFHLINDSNETNAHSYIINNAVKSNSNTYSIIHPTIVSEFNYSGVGLNYGTYNPVLNKNDSINGVSKDTPNIDIGYFSHDIWSNYTEDQIPWKNAYNPYSYMRYNDGRETSVTCEDIFKKAMDPYTGYHAFGIVNKYDTANRRMIHNFGFSYDDPIFLQAFWLHRTFKSYGIGGFSQNLEVHKQYTNPTVNQTFYSNAANNYFTVQDARYESAAVSRDNVNLVISDPSHYTAGTKGAFIFHPMNIKYIAHPMQRTAFFIIHLTWTGSDAPLQNSWNNPNGIVYCGYVNFNTVEIDKYKHDNTLLTNYIRECLMRDNSGFKEFLNNIRYKYIVNPANNACYTYSIENYLARLGVDYTENFNDPNPSYTFIIKAFAKVKIIKKETLNIYDDRYGDLHSKIIAYRSIPTSGATHLAYFLSEAGSTAYNGAPPLGVNWDNIERGCMHFGTTSVIKYTVDNPAGSDIIYCNKYSMFSPDENGWSSFDGQWLPKWPSMVPDALLYKTAQFNFTIPVDSNPSSSELNAGSCFSFFATMWHPYYCGWNNGRISNIENLKFYGSVDFHARKHTDPINNTDPLISFSGIRRNVDNMSGNSQMNLFRMAAWSRFLAKDIYNNNYKSIIRRDYTRSTPYFKEPGRSFDPLNALAMYNLTNNTREATININNVNWNNPNGVYVHVNPAAIAMILPQNRNEYEPLGFYFNLARFDIRDYGADYFNNNSKWVFKQDTSVPKEISIGVDETIGRFGSCLPISEKL